MSVDPNKGMFRWVVFLWLLIHRAKASECFCTLDDSSTPVHSQPNAVSETVGFMEPKTCFRGNFVPGMQWIKIDKIDIFIRKDSLTACPDGLVETIAATDFKTLKYEKTTNSRLRKEERRFLLDSVNQAQCDFEVNSFCSWRNIQGGNDDFDWVLYQSSTPTDDTGPKFDHTLNNATGSYMFIESSAPRNTLDTAWIQSPQIDAKDVPVHCFRFWYHMFGSSIGRLNIYQVTDGSLPGNLVWSLTGDQGSTWMEGQVPLSSNHSYSMLISGVVGNGYQGDIAIDDVSVLPGYCEAKPLIASRTNVANNVEGVWGIWGAWHTCTVTCGGGQKLRGRQCNFPPGVDHGKNCTGKEHDFAECSTNLCPVDARWSTWSAFSTCSETCGGGQRIKTRHCIYDPIAQKGLNCTGPSVYLEQCNTNECPVDGFPLAWNAWSSCSASCGDGVHTRTRDCFFPPNNPHAAFCSEQLNETAPCNVQLCPSDGFWSDWSNWSTCTQTCGLGAIRFRARVCVFKYGRPHGQNCVGDTIDREICKLDICAVDARWSTWSAFTPCSKTCGGGQRTKTRQQCIFDPNVQGENCTGLTSISEGCNTHVCPVDGVLLSWNPWSFCSVSCNGGVQYRSRDCYFNQNIPHGADCIGRLTETTACNIHDCPTSTGSLSTTTLPALDGFWTNWSAYSRCSVSCGSGLQRRTRLCQFDPKYIKGNDCPGNGIETRSCDNQPCPVDGVFENWSTWSACPVTCGGGIKDRTRVCHFPTGVPHGSDCLGVAHENQTCGTSLCPVNGHWSAWDSWGSCSVTCDIGQHTRNRTCVHDPLAPQGTRCQGADHQSEFCTKSYCPRDGLWLSWSDWSLCSTSCGHGLITRRRKCVFPVPLAPQGKFCEGPVNETQACINTTDCTVDGVWLLWTTWTSCSATCGGGSRNRTRECRFPTPQHGDYCVGNDTDTESCSTNLCPVLTDGRKRLVRVSEEVK